MEKKKYRNRTEEEEFSDEGGIVSATEMTGLIAAYPATEEEQENYADILQYRSTGRKKRT